MNDGPLQGMLLLRRNQPASAIRCPAGLHRRIPAAALLGLAVAVCISLPAHAQTRETASP